MARVSGRQVARWAMQAGFTNTGRDDLTIAVAVARGESGWNTTARLHTSREDSRGLWQINTLAHPWGKKINLYNGRVNANAARRVWRQAGGSWRPWTVYTRGIYLQYMDEARAAVRAAGGDRGAAPKVKPGGAPSAFNYYKNIRKLGSSFGNRVKHINRRARKIRRFGRR